MKTTRGKKPLTGRGTSIRKTISIIDYADYAPLNPISYIFDILNNKFSKGLK